jgi:hypothetical protein
VFHNRVSWLLKLLWVLRSQLRPAFGAYLASRPSSWLAIFGSSYNVYASAAFISVALLLFETIYLAIGLPETRNWVKEEHHPSSKVSGFEQDSATQKGSGSKAPETEPKTQSLLKAGDSESVGTRLHRLRTIGWYHLAFLLFFSGVSSNMDRLNDG